ncbi:MAG: hypothetical protein V7K62_15375 [Nostoc sp.]
MNLIILKLTGCNSYHLLVGLRQKTTKKEPKIYIQKDFNIVLLSLLIYLRFAAIATLDKDFNIYRRYRNQPFKRVFYP